MTDKITVTVTAEAFAAIDSEITATIQVLGAIPSLSETGLADLAAGLALESIEALARLQGLFSKAA